MGGGGSGVFVPVGGVLLALSMVFAVRSGLAERELSDRVEPVAEAVPDRWVCQGEDGAFVSVHVLQADAVASCVARAKAVTSGIFIVVPESVHQPQARLSKSIVLKSAQCQQQSCLASVPVSGIRGSWTWMPPTALENGNIHTDLSHFEMYRQSFGGEPEVFAEISNHVTQLIWGMDTRYANACFWIRAVRINSASMASDSSKKICMDAKGQPLPTT